MVQLISLIHYKFYTYKYLWISLLFLFDKHVTFSLMLVISKKYDAEK